MSEELREWIWRKLVVEKYGKSERGRLAEVYEDSIG